MDDEWNMASLSVLEMKQGIATQAQNNKARKYTHKITGTNISINEQ